MKRKQDRHRGTIVAFLVLLLCIYLEFNEWKKRLKLFSVFSYIRLDGLGPNQFQRVYRNNIPVVEDLLTFNSLLRYIHIVDRSIMRELVRRSVQKHENTVRLLRYNNHIFYISNIFAFFQSFRCSDCETSFSRTSKLERLLTTCSERVKIFIPGTCVKSEKLSLTNWTLLELSMQINKNSYKISKFRLRINLCPRRDLQRYKDNKLDRKTRPEVGAQSFTLLRTNFLLQL